MSFPRQKTKHDVGDKVRSTCTFTDVASSTPVDPTTVKVTVTDPNDTATTYIYGTDPEIVKDSAGTYHTDIYLTVAGIWTVRWFSEGSAEAAEVHYLVAIA